MRQAIIWANDDLVEGHICDTLPQWDYRMKQNVDIMHWTNWKICILIWNSLKLICKFPIDNAKYKQSTFLNILQKHDHIIKRFSCIFIWFVMMKWCLTVIASVPHLTIGPSGWDSIFQFVVIDPHRSFVARDCITGRLRGVNQWHPFWETTWGGPWHPFHYWVCTFILNTRKTSLKCHPKF